MRPSLLSINVLAVVTTVLPLVCSLHGLATSTADVRIEEESNRHHVNDIEDLRIQDTELDLDLYDGNDYDPLNTRSSADEAHTRNLLPRSPKHGDPLPKTFPQKTTRAILQLAMSQESKRGDAALQQSFDAKDAANKEAQFQQQILKVGPNLGEMTGSSLFWKSTTAETRHLKKMVDARMEWESSAKTIAKVGMVDRGVRARTVRAGLDPVSWMDRYRRKEEEERRAKRVGARKKAEGGPLKADPGRQRAGLAQPKRELGQRKRLGGGEKKAGDERRGSPASAKQAANGRQQETQSDDEKTTGGKRGKSPGSEQKSGVGANKTAQSLQKFMGQVKRVSRRVSYQINRAMPSAW